jgi:hypothetical protein
MKRGQQKRREIPRRGESSTQNWSLILWMPASAKAGFPTLCFRQ